MFLVIMQHFGYWFDYTSVSGRFITVVLIPDGGFGLDMFFVLSGFLITSILLNAKNKSSEGGRFTVIKAFFLRRALRIFPVYYLLLLVLFIINYPDIRQYFWYFATYTSNILSYRTNSWNHFSHTWSLAVEEQFYLLWPWLVIYIPNKYLRYVFSVAVVGGLISTYIAVGVQGRIAPLLMLNCLDALGLGGLLALAKLNRQHYKRFCTAIKILVLPAVCFYFYWKAGLFNNHVMPGLFLMKSVNSVISVWIIILVLNNRSALIERYFLGNRFLNYIGQISYGIYLYHYAYTNYFFNYVNKFFYDITLPYPWLNKTVHDSHVDYWIEVAIMILIASVSYRFIEKPILNLKKYFNYNKVKPVVISSVQTK